MFSEQKNDFDFDISKTVQDVKLREKAIRKLVS